MQTYILSNQIDEYWTGKKFIENELVTEDNPNYQFIGFNSPEKAKFFNPMLQNLPELKIWECEPKESASQNWLFTTYKSVLTKSVCQIDDLTDLQYIAMAILGILSVIRNNKIRCFCFDYLRNKNRKPETAEKLYKRLSEKNNNTRPEEEYIGPAWSFLNGIQSNQIKHNCTKSLYRSICDSHCIDAPLDFQNMYTMVKTFSLEEIADKIKNNSNPS